VANTLAPPCPRRRDSGLKGLDIFQMDAKNLKFLRDFLDAFLAGHAPEAKKFNSFHRLG
jgi:hypothetical protein